MNAVEASCQVPLRAGECGVGALLVGTEVRRASGIYRGLLPVALDAPGRFRWRAHRHRRTGGASARLKPLRRRRPSSKTRSTRLPGNCFSANWRLPAVKTSRYGAAVDCFDQGLQKLAKVETRLTGEPAAEERISTDAATAMRLDAVRVRQASILQRRQMARDEERARLNQLRAMVRSFRDVTEKMALADFYYRAGDHPACRENQWRSPEGD